MRASRRTLRLASQYSGVELHHREVVLRDLAQLHRELRDREEDVQELKRRQLHRLAVVPHDHVGVDHRAAAQQPQIDRLHFIGEIGVRAVARPEHVAVLAYQRPDVSLPELDHHVRLEAPNGSHDVGHQAIGRLVHRCVVAAAGGIQHGLLVGDEALDEIELESVDAPVADGPHVRVDEVLPHLRIPRVQHVRAEALVEPQRLVLESRRRLGVLPHERHGIPEHDFHAEARGTHRRSLSCRACAPAPSRP